MANKSMDDFQTMYAVASQSILSGMSDKHKLEQIAGCAAVFTMALCKDYDLDPRACALDIPYWIHQLSQKPDFIYSLKMDKAPKSKGRGETVKQNGMDYTSTQVIHKVIDPLFLNDLKKELATIKALNPPEDRMTALLAFQDKLASLKFLDPACGSGNFLVETYICLRQLENEIIAELVSLGVKFSN